MKIRQIFRSISDPVAFIIQQVTWTGELKFQYIGSDLYSRIKWLDICNLTSWTSWSLRKTGANQPQRHLLHGFRVCSECSTEGWTAPAETTGSTFLQDCFFFLTHANDFAKTWDWNMQQNVRTRILNSMRKMCANSVSCGNLAGCQFYLFDD